MSNRTDSGEVRYEWVIEGNFVRSLYEGSESDEALGNLFAMWARDQGDISDWEIATEFGKFVAAYSDLSPVVVCVWLGLELGAVRAASMPVEEPPWEFEGPDNRLLTINRNELTDKGRC